MPRRPAKRPALPEQLVTHPAQLAACLAHLADMPLIGFDTEFVGEDAYRPELCLVQVSTAEQLFVIDPFECGPLDEFWQILLDPERTVVVHAGREDVRMCYFQAGSAPPNVFDVQIAAGLVGMTYPIGYAGLVHDLLHQRMQKGETLTDWRKRPLTPAQVRYAYDDVRYLLPAHRKLTERLKRYKRLEWAEEEFATAVRKAVADDVTVERWRKIKGIGALDRRALAVAREVYGWRDKFAEKLNRPPRFLMRDDLLIEIARRAPTKADELHAVRGLPRGQEEAILDAIRRAKALPPEECPEPETRDNDTSNVVLLGNLLNVVLADFAGRNRLAANLVSSGADLKAIVRSRAAGEPLPDVALCRGWRAKAVLPELLAILSGDTAIRVADPKAAEPLELVELEPEDEEEQDEE
ncbi:ribonuclease d : Ribonuclease D OS=Planctomyces limnophilus (strain ATCC 43296 / DSM 3776 / IFAM 1008 / 290) GN=Plim_0672 PE=4 SV=1: DNA_pol_A_exo1: HRDC [Gemmata massiliana]|uniref:HRDC domain-containing protein n=1 Tax=Gemmata massiliana TaxID=1210884 RepID=A0A6P2D6C9_9BACT|nr:HRDC domain-containing protein [Gemmata massiliana]VTR94980.1 ribonuclease d : Ribonuclease D OS=Planctomyces limnophilus (strain ATCC 43296 / DSM 3776 / IFAM 1008 / 290) GN=Plim_0672 PE=4 SV=1: DNA_pol_A_exo1: HRDC [Gemmata massiliana]